ncbi:MAG: type IX secretion system outer membrane channel protein PorV [Paludibacteraceae bacterium]|nr:type IX secretion system outer membrane channel protein PorV [Paludibacteraceae bacterium]
MRNSLSVKLLLISICFSSLSFAGSKDQLNPIYTGVPSLTITPDARSGGMGDVGAATSADANSQYWNPSKYVFMDSPAGVSLSYTPWMSKIVKDINLAYLCGYYKLNDKQAISASLRYFSLGSIDLTNEDGSSIGSTTPNEFSIDVAYSRLLTERFSAGVALRYISSNLTGGMVDNYYTGTSIAADISATYKKPIQLSSSDGSLAFGANISNIGSKVSYDKGAHNTFIPTNLRIGTSFLYPIDQYNSLTASLDLNKLLVPSKPLLSNYSDTTAYNNDLSTYDNQSPISGMFKSFGDGFSEEMKEIAWAFGLEYAYNKQFMVRGGYFHESETKGNRKYFTAGVGFKLNMFQLDASYVIATAQTNPLDQTLRFSLAFDLNGMKDFAK